MDHLDRIRIARLAHDAVVAQATADFHTAIADALRAGEQVQDVATASGYHRNHIGRIRRAHNIPDARRRPRKPSGDQ